MLVLTRKRGELIFIGEDISIKVISIGRDGCRIGITAPREISIARPDMRSGRLLDADVVEVHLIAEERVHDGNAA